MISRPNPENDDSKSDTSRFSDESDKKMTEKDILKERLLKLREKLEKAKSVAEKARLLEKQRD